MGSWSYITGILVRRWPCEDTETQEELHVRLRAEIRVREQKPMNAKDGQGVTRKEKIWNRFFLTALRENQAY